MAKILSAETAARSKKRMTLLSADLKIDYYIYHGLKENSVLYRVFLRSECLLELRRNRLLFG